MLHPIGKVFGMLMLCFTFTILTIDIKTFMFESTGLGNGGYLYMY